MTKWKTEAAIVLAALIVAISILFVDRYQITAIGYGFGGDDGTQFQAVFRLDRWTGKVEVCHTTGWDADGAIGVACPWKKPSS